MSSAHYGMKPALWTVVIALAGLIFLSLIYRPSVAELDNNDPIPVRKDSVPAAVSTLPRPTMPPRYVQP
jgi:hypothetical protein